MTEAGEKWAFDCANKAWTEGDEPPALPEQAEFWLRALIADVEKRANEMPRFGKRKYSLDEVHEAFDSLKRELLG